MANKSKKIIISIDGTAAAGKQRIAKHIAKKYNFFHLDSGILYRRLALIFTKKNFLFNNHNLNFFLNSITFISTRNHYCLRTEKISKISSKLATKQIVRSFINKQQRIIIEKKLEHYKGCVIDGRDIGSKVFKNAKIKLYIDAKVKRRWGTDYFYELIEYAYEGIEDERQWGLAFPTKNKRNKK